MNIILFGPPASGKGTQAKIFAQKFGLRHISTGDMFRQHIKNNTEIGRSVLQIEDGKYASDEITIKMVQSEIESSHLQHFIFDGFPRTSPQAAALDKMVTISKVIFLTVDKETLEYRVAARKLKENRADDDLLKFKKRYEDYQNSYAELKSYYSNINYVDGTAPVEEVTNQIFKIIIS